MLLMEQAILDGVIDQDTSGGLRYFGGIDGPRHSCWSKIFWMMWSTTRYFCWSKIPFFCWSKILLMDQDILLLIDWCISVETRYCRRAKMALIDQDTVDGPRYRRLTKTLPVETKTLLMDQDDIHSFVHSFFHPSIKYIPLAMDQDTFNGSRYSWWTKTHTCTAYHHHHHHHDHHHIITTNKLEQDTLHEARRGTTAFVPSSMYIVD